MRRAGDVLDGFEALPETCRDEAVAGVCPLILAPHPDDESLGCGGLIAAACAAGRPPVVAILTDGAASHPGSAAYPPERLRRLRREEAIRAVTVLGLAAERLVFLDFSDAAMADAGPAFDQAVAMLADCARHHACGAVIGPWEHDPHCDHAAGARLAAAVAALTRLALRSYPVWGWLLPREAPVAEARLGGYRLNIARHLAAKARAIAAHESQYGALIDDAADGFRLPAALLAVFQRPFEVYIAP